MEQISYCTWLSIIFKRKNNNSKVLKKKKVHASSQKMIIGAKEGHEFIIRHFPTDQ